MRALAAAALAFALLVPAFSAHAEPVTPLPKTERAAKALVRDVLQDTDVAGAELLSEARKLVREAREALPDAPALPPAPAAPDLRQGTLEVRASLVQPGVANVDTLVGAMWIGAREHYWTGVYWAESDGAGQLTPRFLDINTEGAIFFVEAGALARGASVNITYHFLGLDGRHLVHPLGEIPILPAIPALDRVEIAGAHASSRGGPFEALLVSPWNLYDHNVTVGMTSLAGDVVLEETVVTACADWDVEEMEPGCRLVYALYFPESMSALQVWTLDDDGERVVERELARAELLAGVTFKPE